MRTRRSWRNQDRLWRALGQEGIPSLTQPKRDPIAGLEAMLAQQGLSPRTRRQLERDLARAKVARALRKGT